MPRAPELASALGSTRKSSSYYRQNGVPESRLGDLMRLARERGRDQYLSLSARRRRRNSRKGAPPKTTDTDGKPAVHFAEIIALGLGPWCRRCESRGETIEVPLPTQPDIVRPRPISSSREPRSRSA